MIRNYFKTVFRTLLSNKLYSIINIIGLAIGLACSITIFLFVEFETSFDKHFKNHEQIYRVVSTKPNVDRIDFDGATPFPMGYSLRNDFPDLTIASSYLQQSQDIMVNEVVYRERNILYMDSVFHQIFDLRWIQGSAELVSEHPGNIALTESLANKYFPDENPIGKSIIFSPDKTFQVVGVIADPPKNSSLQLSCAVSVKNITTELMNGFSFDEWGTSISGFETFFKIPSNVDVENFTNVLNEVVDKYFEDEQDDPNRVQYTFQKLRDVHLEPDFQTKANTYSSSKASLWVYGLIGLLILTIAGINFINLTTAQGLKRAKEVGVRKVLGASKTSLRMRFIVQFAFTSLLSMIMAIILVEIILPDINTFLGNHTELSIYGSKNFVGFIILLFIFINLLTSVYPALVMSRFIPIKALKGGLLNSGNSKFNLRNALLVFQFTISIALISGTIIIRGQMNYVKNKDLGFEINNTQQFIVPQKDRAKMKSLGDFISNQPSVSAYAYGFGAPASTGNITTSLNREGEDNNGPRYRLNVKPVDKNYKDLFKLELLAGEWLFETPETDTIMRVVISEQLLPIMDWSSPEDAIYKDMRLFGRNAKVIGVVKNFHIYSLRSESIPLVFVDFPEFYNYLFVNINPKATKNTVSLIESKMQELFPSSFIVTGSLQESIENMYTNERKTSVIISVLSGLAIFIAALGLFGIVSYMMIQKVKEIGIRKVLGASLQQLASALTKTYFYIILISSVIAIPLCWYFMDRWLSEFKYRIDISIWFFLISIGITLAIALITVLYHVIKAGQSNPVEALKYE